LNVFQSYATKVISTLHNDENGKIELKDVLCAVWGSQEITDVCPDLVIRLTSLRGEV
jgi:hypothetical protein